MLAKTFAWFLFGFLAFASNTDAEIIQDLDFFMNYDIISQNSDETEMLLLMEPVVEEETSSEEVEYEN